MTDFASAMRKRTSYELIVITTIERTDYHPDALLAAEAELNSRNLTAQQLIEIHQTLDFARQEEERKTEKRREVALKITDLADTLHPMAHKDLGQMIKLMTIVFILGFVVDTVRSFDMWGEVLEELDKGEFSILRFVIPAILFPIGIYGFWKMQKYGWVILVIVMTKSVVSSVMLVLLLLKLNLVSARYPEGLDLGRIFGGTDWGLGFGQVFLFGGILYMLNRSDMMEAYKINRQTQLLVIVMTAIPFIALSMQAF